MLRLKITADDDARLRTHLLRGAGADEEAAFLLAAVREHADGVDFLVRDVLPVPDEALLYKRRAGLQIDPIFIARVLKRARTEKLSIFLCHSHPFTGQGVSFSGIDDAGEAELFPRFLDQVPGRAHGAMVFGRESRDGRVWLPGVPAQAQLDEVLVIGQTLEVITPTSARSSRCVLTLDEATARQVLAIGEAANKKLSLLRIGLIGAGGVGSVVFDGLVRMGVADIVPVDGDILAASNVSRQTGGGLLDVGRLKVEVLADSARRIGFGTSVQDTPRWVQAAEATNALLACDIVVVATDNMKSRLFASRLGMQYMIPIVSVGIDIIPGDHDSITAIGGHVACQYPDGPCLDCLGLIDQEMLAREEMSPEVRAANPYIRGRSPDEPVPSVIVFNQIVGGLVGAELLQLATGRLRPIGKPTYLMFDGRTGETRRVMAKAIRNCGACAEARAWGDRFTLPIDSKFTTESGGA